MKYKVIKTEQDYELALAQLERIFDAKLNSKEGDELEILSLLIEQYEKTHYSFAQVDPIEAVKFRMEQLGLKQKDLAKSIGFASRVSEVLNKKRKLTLEMIRKLHEQLNIPTHILIQEY